MGELLGWIKLYRELLNKAIWKCSTSEQKSLLITLLLLANHELNQWMFKGEKYECRSGQLITSLESLSKRAGISISKVRTGLKKFEKMEFLINESTNKNRLITIINYEAYQNNPLPISKAPDKHTASKQQTGNKQPATNKNDKNVKKFIAPTLEEVKEFVISRGYDESLAIKAYEYYDSADWHDRNGNKVRNWKQKILAVWLKEENKTQKEENLIEFKRDE